MEEWKKRQASGRDPARSRMGGPKKEPPVWNAPKMAWCGGTKLNTFLRWAQSQPLKAFQHHANLAHKMDGLA